MQEKKKPRPAWQCDRGPKDYSMKTNTDLPLKFLPIEEVVRQLKAVQDVLLYESFGRDHEARYDLMNERSRLHKELKRRGVTGY